MRLLRLVRSSLVAAGLALTSLVGCTTDTASTEDNVVDTKNTDVERQSIGNCWLYATASWAESLHLYATDQQFDISQSYWTYWHWFDEIVGGYGDEIETGGSEHVAFDIIKKRGLMSEADFIPEDTVGEMSRRQATALDTINAELKSGGRLSTVTARANKKLVRQVLDEAWGLSSDVRAQLTQAFGSGGGRTFQTNATNKGTKILRAKDFKVRYPERITNPNVATMKDTTLAVAMTEYRTVDYPSWGSDLAAKRRQFQIRLQRAMHDGAPVIITWMVDFNAMESGSGPLRGSFNKQTLDKNGPGRQGGHMTVMEDYEVITKDYGVLAAGTTLDPANPEDAKKLEAALLPSSEIKFWRIKNSWGAFRDDRSSAPGFPGYHDLYMDYMNGPITWCPSVEGAKNSSNCRGKTDPFENVVLPPGY
jgi:hypothetical protein